MRTLDAKGIHMVAGQRRNLAMPSEAADIETREGRGKCLVFSNCLKGREWLRPHLQPVIHRRGLDRKCWRSWQGLEDGLR